MEDSYYYFLPLLRFLGFNLSCSPSRHHVPTAQVSDSATMENHSQYHGSVIAFEGPETLVSTQLRLLPISPQLLILPSLQHYMEEDSNTPFDSRSCIKDVHQAALARHEAALQFLNGSSSNNKKLVFLNGGTAAAVSQCISVISERQASGDIILAEAIYKNIAGEGVRGLDLQGKYANREALDKLNSERDLDEALWEDDNEDPITKAMRAADALYRETESLQPVDCYIRTRSRSLSLPMFDYANDLGQVSPFFVFGSSPSEGAPSVFGGEDEEEAHTAVAEKDPNGGPNLKKFPGGQRLRISVPHRSASSMAEAVHGRNVEHRSTIQLFSSAAGGFMSPPITPEGVVYGEARLVQMQASKSQGLRKIRSLDDMELTEARRRRISIQMPAAQRASPIDSPDPKSRHLSIVEDPYSPNNLVHLPLAKFVKARTTTIRKSPTFWKALPQPARQTYVHQGTDVADFGRDNADLDTEFEPVLPLYEDLVVHFTSFSPDYVLDSVIQSFKNGLYPILGNTSESFGGTAETDSCPSTPRTADLFDLEDSKGDGLSPVAEVPSADEASDYDPYAARASDVRCGHKMALQQSSTPPPHAQQPPAPAQAHEQHVDAKFHEFPTAGRLNAIVTQNELRSVLEQYFPHQESVGYLQFNSSLLPDMNELWRPIFQGFEAQGSTSAQHTADLILAIGCQKGVKSEFVSALTGQVEKLGTKSNGASRNGRLDIRLVDARTRGTPPKRINPLPPPNPADRPSQISHSHRHAILQHPAPNVSLRQHLLRQPLRAGLPAHPPSRNLPGRQHGDALPPPLLPRRAPRHRARVAKDRWRRPAQNRRHPRRQPSTTRPAGRRASFALFCPQHRQRQLSQPRHH